MKALLCLAAVALAACVLSSQAAPPHSAKADAEFEKLADDFIGGYLAARPLQGVALGLHEYDGKIGDYTRLAIDAEVERLKRFQDQLRKINPSNLGATASIDRRILQSAINSELFQIVDLDVFEKNPMVYARAIDVNVYIRRDFKPLEDRLRDIVTIEDQTPNIMTAGKTNLAEFLPKPYVELGIQAANGAADFLEKDVVAAVKGVEDEQLMAAFQDSNNKAIAALRDFATWLTKERLPKATGSFALGPEKFRRALATTELVDIAPEKLLEIGLQRLKEQQDAFTIAAKIIDPKKPPIEVFRQIQAEHPQPGDLIPSVTKDLDQIRQFVIDHQIVAIPSQVRPMVTAMPQFERATSRVSMDTPGPFEKKATEAYYYVTPPEENWSKKEKEEWLTAFNFYTTDVVSMDEVYPGHYVQFLHLNAFDATKVEKIFSSDAFVAGWGHYCEQMMLDQGFGTAPKPTPEQAVRAAKFRMAQANEALLQLCRLCVSVKLHTQGMSVEEAAKFFQQNCYYPPKPAYAEAIRGTFDPGYLNDSLGKLVILKLRNDYQAQEGKRFSLEKFHNQMLDHGMPPIRLLREILLKDKEKWGAVL